MTDKVAEQPGKESIKGSPMGNNTRLFQVMAKDNFQIKYQQKRAASKSASRAGIDLNRFESHFQSSFIPQDAVSIYNPSVSAKSNGFRESNMSQWSRNTARFDKKQSYYFQEELQQPFMKGISKTHSFAFKSLPRKVIRAKEVEQSNERLQQILRREDYKYTISPLVHQELFQEAHQVNHRAQSEKKASQIEHLQKHVNFTAVKNMHQHNLEDKSQKYLQSQVKDYKALRKLVSDKTRFDKQVEQQFKSGILNLDGPLSSHTTLFKSQQRGLEKNSVRSQLQQENHRRLVAARQGTHKQIDISNYYNNQNRMQSEEKQLEVPSKVTDGELVMQGKQKFDIDYLKYYEDSTCYDGIKKQESKVDKREKRKGRLVSQQHRGKTYDIVSNNQLTPL